MSMPSQSLALGLTLIAAPQLAPLRYERVYCLQAPDAEQSSGYCLTLRNSLLICIQISKYRHAAGAFGS